MTSHRPRDKTQETSHFEPSQSVIPTGARTHRSENPSKRLAVYRVDEKMATLNNFVSKGITGRKTPTDTVPVKGKGKSGSVSQLSGAQ